MSKNTNRQTHFHRSQIGRAQQFIRKNFSDSLSLVRISREAGSSSYHFARLFLAYTGETPFEFLRRVRLGEAIRRLHGQAADSVTEIALSVGYETCSAFNKAFKKALQMSPGDFRKLGQEQQEKLIYDLSQARSPKESRLDLSAGYELVQRNLTHYLFRQATGSFGEVAPPLWEEMLRLIAGRIEQVQLAGYLGLSAIDKDRRGEEAMIYQAGVALVSAPSEIPKGLCYKAIPPGSYARFTLKGRYSQIWAAFHQVYQVLGESNMMMRKGFCIEDYINDPNVTPEEELVTYLLVPVEEETSGG